MRKTLLRLVVVAGFVATIGQVGFPSLAQAINPADFNPGRIIDDELFYKKDDMSVGEIQAFLNAHVPACDTWGTGPSGYGNLTRAQYAQQIMGWHGPPYTCLNNYHENPDTGATSFENGGGAFAGGISAAQIIYNAAQQYGINPKVLLVTLRKEALNIYGDSWPLKSQYRYAMGYACPDSGPNYSAACVDSKSGFYKQITLAAWQFRYYYDNMGTYNFAPGRWNTIQYNPQPSCGTKDVYIQNYATASLYIYTPYTPNDAALRAYPGEASCGAYGNRNFWYMWQEWFGSTYAQANLISDLSISHDKLGRMYTGERTASFTVRNSTSNTVDLGQIGVASRSPSGRTDGFAMKSVVLAPYQTYTYTDTQSHFTEEGEYHFWIVSLKNGTYEANLPSSYSPELVREWWVYIQNAPTITTDVVVDQPRPTQNSTVSMSYTIRNNSARAVSLGDMGLSLRHEDGTNVGMPMMRGVTIPANETVTIKASRWLPRTGSYTAWVINTKDGGVSWDDSFPASASDLIKRRISFEAKTPVSIQATPSSLPTLISVGQDVAYTFKVRNYTSVDYVDGQIGLAVRDPDNVNVGYDMQHYIVPANGEFNYTVDTKRFTKPGKYTAWIVRYEGGVWTSYDVVENSSVLSRFTFNVAPNLNLTENPSLTEASIHANQPVGGVMRIKNNAASVARDYDIGLAVRDPYNRNVGYDMRPLSIAANGEYIYDAPMRSFNVPGEYKAWIVQYNGKDYITYNKLNSGVSPSIKFTVKPDATLQATPTITPANPKVGDSVIASFTIKNYSKYQALDYPLGLVVIDPNGKNVGYAMQDVKIPVGGTFNYNVPARSFNTPGVYTAWIVQNSNGYWSQYNKVEDSSISPKFQFTVE